MPMRQTSLLGFVKGTSSIGCVGAESNAPVDSNAGEPSRCTSGIEYFCAEDGTSVESSIGEPSCKAQLCCIFGGPNLWELRMAASLWGSGGMPPRKIWNFRHSEILSRAILQALHQSPVHCCSWGTKGASYAYVLWLPDVKIGASAVEE